MTSAINPNNIDGAYPVAGQDNDSQGFRDNFTNTKTNFAYAAAEITDLQSKAVLKAALTGTTLDNDMGGAALSNAVFSEISGAVENVGNVSIGNTVTLDFSTASYYKITPLGNCSVAFSNLPAAGNVGTIRLQVDATANASTNITFPSAVNIGTNNIQNLSGNVLSFVQSGIYEYEFEFSSGNTGNISMFDLNNNRDPLYLPSSEDLAASGAASLTKTTSYFTTAATETSTLAAGTTGQIKVLAAVDVASGNMTCTVSNAGWKSSGTGTIEFDQRGQTVTLMYINSKWFCIGQGAGASNGFAQFA